MSRKLLLFWVGALVGVFPSDARSIAFRCAYQTNAHWGLIQMAGDSSGDAWRLSSNGRKGIAFGEHECAHSEGYVRCRWGAMKLHSLELNLRDSRTKPSLSGGEITLATGRISLDSLRADSKMWCVQKAANSPEDDE